MLDRPDGQQQQALRFSIAFNANRAYTVSATYTQSEVSALATGLQQARQRIKALEDAIRTHGLIN